MILSFLAGLVLAGIGAFFMLRSHKSSAAKAQQEALDNTVRLYEQDKRFVGVKLPTGAGKSFVAMAEMMRRKKENVLLKVYCWR